MLFYDRQFEKYSDLKDNYKTLSYFHKDVQFFTQLNIAIFKNLEEGVIMMKLPNM